MNEALPNRQSIRMKGWDYTAGCYFVTMNTYKSQALFGAIVNGKMVLSEAGKIAEEEWRKSAVIREEIELDEFVIMPNHVHGIVRLKGRPAGRPSTAGRSVLAPGSLGAFIAGYKGAAGRRINLQRGKPGAVVWHRNYWDVIVQDEKALAGIRNYIRFNPQNYDVMMKVGDPQFVGDETLLKLLKTGFLASRGAAVLHGHLPVNSGDAVISGFLSPMERAVFKAGLAQKRPLIWVKPWGLEPSEGLPLQTRAALDEGRLLMVSPFDDGIEAPSVRRAAWCNQYVLAHCDRMVVGHLNPGGMLTCILSESDPELETLYL
jgi:REP element-mobilizing transposase RayT